MKKEKTETRMVFRVKSGEKERIERSACRCGLSVSEYLRQRALCYEPRAIPTDALFRLCEKRDALTEPPFSIKVNRSALDVLHAVNTELIEPGKAVGAGGDNGLLAGSGKPESGA